MHGAAGGQPAGSGSQPGPPAGAAASPGSAGDADDQSDDPTCTKKPRVDVEDTARDDVNSSTGSSGSLDPGAEDSADVRRGTVRPAVDQVGTPPSP